VSCRGPTSHTTTVRSGSLPTDTRCRPSGEKARACTPHVFQAAVSTLNLLSTYTCIHAQLA
jgi:hypothetical protein